MKRGSSVLPPPSDAAKRHTHAATSQRARTQAAGDGARQPLSAEQAPDAHAAGSSPFPAATTLFSPDVGTKMASDLLIRLSEATQKAQMHPGRLAEAAPQRSEARPEVRGGQQDEPGLALSPDGPGASPEPPSLSHTPDGNAATDTQASDLLRKLAERQEVSVHVVKVKEEEEPMQVDALVTSDLSRDRPIPKEMASPRLKTAGHRVFSIKAEDRALNSTKGAEQLHPGDKMADGRLRGVKIEDTFPAGPKAPHGVVSGDNGVQFRVTMEDRGVSGVKMEEQLLFQARIAERAFSGASDAEERPPPGAAGPEDHVPPGAKMGDQCLRAALWQDMSVNLASTLLHQLSERVGKANAPRPEGRTAPPATSSPVLKVAVDTLCSSPLWSSQEPPHETQSSLSRARPPGCLYFYRCHVCGFETDGRSLFQSHMTDHRQWEHGSFSLHCCVCDHSTNQEAEMRAHAVTHAQGNAAPRCPVTTPAASGSTPSVAVATQFQNSTSEHRCRICQRSFPGQQELQVHFQGHRQGNQYRCDRCGHLTRTANKLVEHVRVHTGERPFTCDLCPYSAKRRDSLRLHCKVKHPGDVHTHRSYVHRDNQRANKHVQRLHTPPNAHPAAASSSSSSLPPLHPSLCDRAGWRDLSPLLPITTLISLKPRPLPSSSSASSSSSAKHSFLGYLGLTAPL
ncbi:uncharacterized protein ACO6RY_03136 [Pungitius sinensis]